MSNQMWPSPTHFVARAEWAPELPEVFRRDSREAHPTDPRKSAHQKSIGTKKQ